MKIKTGDVYYTNNFCNFLIDFDHVLNVPKDTQAIVQDEVEGIIHVEICGEKIGIPKKEFIEKFYSEKAETKEMVNHPKHYGGDTQYECIKVLKAWLSPDEYKGFLKGNAIKYLCRTGKKDETTQELKKALWYIQKLIEAEEE